MILIKNYLEPNHPITTSFLLIDTMMTKLRSHGNGGFGLMSDSCWIPAGQHTEELVVAKSRFIAVVYPVDSVELARQQIAQQRGQFPDANHHVYAFRVGCGNSVIDGMSDDGEPSGTAGPPVMSVLRGSGLSDVLVVVTRYFGGTKLGTGGLVRAYSESASLVLKAVGRIKKIETVFVTLIIPYPTYTPVKRVLAEYSAEIRAETFDDVVELRIELPLAQVQGLQRVIQEMTAGNLVFMPD